MSSSDLRAKKVGERSPLGWMLMGLLGIQLAIAAPVSWVMDSYFRVDVPASLMYFGKDGWCDIATQGVGRHCFGDFNERFMIDPSRPPAWPNNLELSPLGPFITQTANTLAAFLPQRVVLGLVILVYGACLLVPSVWAARGRPWPLQALIVGVAGIATYPFAATMDRLNAVALAVPLILVFLVALGAGNTRWVLYSVLALSVIKPQFIVLYVVLIAHRRLKMAILGILGSVAACLTLVVAAGGGDLGRISEWLAATTSYGRGGPTAWAVESFTPINASLSRVVYLAETTLESILHGVFGSHAPTWTVTHSSLLLTQLVVAISCGVILVLWGRRIPPVALGIAALVLSTVVIGLYVAAYYLVFTLPVCALLLRRATKLGTESCLDLSGEVDLWSHGHQGSTWLQMTVLVSTTLSCSLLVVPLLSSNGFGFVQDQYHRVGPIMQNLATASWIVFLFVACGVALRSARRKEQELPADITRWSEEVSRSSRGAEGDRLIQ